jgi:hypothetical protein
MTELVSKDEIISALKSELAKAERMIKSVKEDTYRAHQERDRWRALAIGLARELIEEAETADSME